MKTLFYQVKWTKKIENTVKLICDDIDCECAVYPVFGAPANVKEIWFAVKEEDIDYLKRQMSE